MNIKIYGADWCSDCINVKYFFDSKGIEYEYIIYNKNEKTIKFIEKINNGKRIIPTLNIDGKIYSNPGINILMKIIK